VLRQALHLDAAAVRLRHGPSQGEPQPPTALSALLRVVVAGVGDQPPRLTPDPDRRLPGRGASVHLDPRCVDLADKRRAFPRALRLPGPLDVTPVREHVLAAAGQQEPDSSTRPQSRPPQSGPPR